MWWGDVLPVLVIGAAWLYFNAREAERRRTTPERSRRRVRDLEHDYLVRVGAESLLRRILIEDLRQVKAKREAYEYARVHLGVELDPARYQVPTLRSMFSWRRR